MNNDIFRKLANVQLEISQLMANSNIEDIIEKSNSDYLKAKPSIQFGPLKSMLDSKNIDNKTKEQIINSPAAGAMNDVFDDPKKFYAMATKNVSQLPKEKVESVDAFINKRYGAFFNREPNEFLKKQHFTEKELADTYKKMQAKKDEISKKLEADKNTAFKYGLGLIIIGAMFGALLFPTMKTQLAAIIENGKPVMDKVLSSLAFLGTAIIAFVPMALGAMLLWFSFADEKGGPDKGGIIDGIVQGSIVFFQSIENYIFGASSSEEKKETPKVETPKEGANAGTNAYIQQRVAKLQLDLAQLSHDLY